MKLISLQCSNLWCMNVSNLSDLCYFSQPVQEIITVTKYLTTLWHQAHSNFPKFFKIFGVKHRFPKRYVCWFQKSWILSVSDYFVSFIKLQFSATLPNSNWAIYSNRCRSYSLIDAVYIYKKTISELFHFLMKMSK